MTASRWRWLPMLAVALAVAPLPARAQFGDEAMMGMMGTGAQEPTGEQWTVEVKAASGKSVTGPIRIDSVQIRSEFGLYKIKPEKVKSIRFGDEEGPTQANQLVMGGMQGYMIPGAVVPIEGDEIGGTLVIASNWTMTTDLGSLTLDPSQIRSITFLEGPHDEDEDEDPKDDDPEDDDDQDEPEEDEPESDPSS